MKSFLKNKHFAISFGNIKGSKNSTYKLARNKLKIIICIHNTNALTNETKSYLFLFKDLEVSHHFRYNSFSFLSRNKKL